MQCINKQENDRHGGAQGFCVGVGACMEKMLKNDHKRNIIFKKDNPNSL